MQYAENVKSKIDIVNHALLRSMVDVDVTSKQVKAEMGTGKRRRGEV